MKKILSIITTVLLLLVIAVSCAQDVTVDTQLYGAQGSGTFMLNGKYYNTLQEAVNARLGKGAKAAGANDDVIYLTRNAKGPGAKIDDPNISVIIDFAGWTYSFTDVTATQGSTTGTFGLSITNGADVTLKGLEQIDLHDTTSDLTMVYVEGADTKLTIEDAPKMVVEPTQYVFWAANGATLTVGSNSTTAPTTISGKIAATGGTTAESKPVVTFNNNTSVKASEFKADAAVVIVNTSSESTVDSFVASNNAVVVVSGSGDVKIESNDSSDTASYEIQNTSSEATITVKEEGGSDIVINPDEAVVIEDGDQEEKPASYVARIGSTMYESFKAAIDVANASASELTVVLLKDISILDSINITNSMIIDGSGHGIITEGIATSGNMAAFDIINSGSSPIVVDVKDLSIESTKHARVFLINDGEGVTYDNPNILNVTNLVITTDGEALYSNGPTEINAYNCDFTHNGTYLSGKDAVYYSAIIVGYNGTINIYDSKIQSFGNGAATFPSGGTLNIYNTDISSLDDSVSGLTGYLFWARHEKSYDTGAYKDYCGSAIINVYSGSNIGKFRITDDGHTLANRISKINVFDGEYTDVSFSIDDGEGASNASIAITGGTFDVDPSDYVADGYEAIESSGLWTVSKIDEKTARYWIDIAADEFAGGTGEESDPYLISNAKQLARVAKLVNVADSAYTGKFYKLTEDINLSGKVWTPIGFKTGTFAGTIDGNNKKIIGLSNYTENARLTDLADDNNHAYGLIGVAALSKGDVVIKNLTFESVSIDITGGKGTGSVVGYLLNEPNVSTEMLITAVTVESGSVVSNGHSGGIVGKNYGLTAVIEGCTNKASVSGANASGVINYCSNASQTVTVNNCNNYGCITASGSGSYASGIASLISFSSATVSNSLNAGEIIDTHGIKITCIGGVIASGSTGTLTIYNLENTGRVSTPNLNKPVGGIIGYVSVNLVIKAGYLKNSGEIIGDTVAGGIFGTTTNGKIITIDLSNETEEANQKVDFINEGHVAVSSVGTISSVNHPYGAGAIIGYLGSNPSTFNKCNFYNLINATILAPEGSHTGLISGSVANLGYTFNTCSYSNEGTITALDSNMDLTTYSLSVLPADANECRIFGFIPSDTGTTSFN